MTMMIDKLKALRQVSKSVFTYHRDGSLSAINDENSITGIVYAKAVLPPYGEDILPLPHTFAISADILIHAIESFDSNTPPNITLDHSGKHCKLIIGSGRQVIKVTLDRDHVSKEAVHTIEYVINKFFPIKDELVIHTFNDPESCYTWLRSIENIVDSVISQAKDSGAFPWIAMNPMTVVASGTEGMDRDGLRFWTAPRCKDRLDAIFFTNANCMKMPIKALRSMNPEWVRMTWNHEPIEPLQLEINGVYVFVAPVLIDSYEELREKTEGMFDDSTVKTVGSDG